MTIKEYITPKNILFVILALLIIKFLSEIKVITMLFFAAYIIAASLNPLVDKLEKKMKRIYAASIVFSSTLVLLFAFFVPIFFISCEQFSIVMKSLPATYDMIRDFVLNGSVFGQKLIEMVDFTALSTSLERVGEQILNHSIYLTVNAMQAVLFFLLLCILVFYFITDKKIIKSGYMQLFPSNMKDKASEIYDTVSKNVGGYIIAQILIMVVIAVLVGSGMLLLKIDNAIVLGLISGLSDIIPLLGPILALLLCLALAYPLGIFKMFLVLVVYLIAQWCANNLVRPVIFGKFLNLHPLLIILSLLLAAQFLGLWGVILAPAIASVIYELFNELYIKVINKGENDN